MACQQLATEEIKSSTTVQPIDFTYTYGEWTEPKHDYQPADLVEASLVETAASVSYDTSSTNNVKITFNFFKPKENYGWEPDVSDLSISAAVGENGQATLKSINQDYVDMPTQTKQPIQRVFNLVPNPQASDGKLHFKLVDYTKDQKGGLILISAIVDVYSP